MFDVTQREWRFYIDDMIVSIEKAITYTRDLGQENFVANGLSYDATIDNDTLWSIIRSDIPTFLPI